MDLEKQRLFSGRQNQTGRLKSQNLGQTFMLFNDDTASIADDLPPMNTQSIYKRIQTYQQELASWKQIYSFGHKLDCVQKPRFSISIIEILQVDVVH